MAANQRRMPQNAVGGGIQAGIRPEQLDALRNSLASSVGKTYQSGSPRGESAGYTTSSPGWRQPAPPPQIFPPAPALPMAHPAAGGGGGGPGIDPIVTGGAGPARAATAEMIRNATTTPSALFEPMNVAQSPSSLGSFLPVPGPTSAPLTPPMPNVMQTPTSAPGGLGWEATSPSSLGGSLGPAPLVPPHGRGQATNAPLPTIASLPPTPPPVAPNLGDIAAMPEGATRARQGKRTPLAKKGGRVGKGQYGLRKEAATS